MAIEAVCRSVGADLEDEGVVDGGYVALVRR